jgi:hypothetical protein
MAGDANRPGTTSTVATVSAVVGAIAATLTITIIYGVDIRHAFAPTRPDDHLQVLQEACETGDVDACEDLLSSSPLGSIYEEFALSRLAQESTVADAAVKAYERLLREQLQPGAIVYTTPDRMRMEQPATVTARITRDKLESLSDGIYEGLGVVGEVRVEAATLAVGTTMRAILEGEQWEVSLVGPEEQPLRSTGHREWEWQVEATRTGTWPLYLTVYAIYDGDEIDHEVLKEEIIVTVGRFQAIGGFANQNWQWLVAFVFGSGAGGPALVRWWRRRTGQTVAEAPAKEGGEAP